jgi:hypothetical protein
MPHFRQQKGMRKPPSPNVYVPVISWKAALVFAAATNAKVAG